ncbi:MAG: hypothetical protein HYT79_02190 [Elusimicrobia bacterium]|nr:hypothetical protein [Elusimicrobiota bacterium]
MKKIVVSALLILTISRAQAAPGAPAGGDSWEKESASLSQTFHGFKEGPRGAQPVRVANVDYGVEVEMEEQAARATDPETKKRHLEALQRFRAMRGRPPLSVPWKAAYFNDLYGCGDWWTNPSEQERLKSFNCSVWQPAKPLVSPDENGAMRAGVSARNIVLSPYTLVATVYNTIRWQVRRVSGPLKVVTGLFGFLEGIILGVAFMAAALVAGLMGLVIGASSGRW